MAVLLYRFSPFGVSKNLLRESKNNFRCILKTYRPFLNFFRPFSAIVGKVFSEVLLSGFVQGKMFRPDLLLKEKLRSAVEPAWFLGCKEPACSAVGASLFHFGVTMEVVFQAACHIFTLRNNADAVGCVFSDFTKKKREMGATQND